MKYLIFAAVFCCQMNSALAKPYVPTAPDEVIAEWDRNASKQFQTLKTQHHLQPQNLATITELANRYLKEAALPGFDYLYGITEALLKPSIENNTQDLALLLAWAQVQQHQHKFLTAQDALQKILALQPDHVTANLISARLQLIQGNPEGAQRHCLKLLGHTDLLTLSACTLEARSHLNDKALAESYTQLQHLLASHGLPDDERQAWILQMLADMAVQLQQHAAALEFLNKISQPKTLSVWVQWADINLALGNHQSVSDQLAQVIENAGQPDDALLLRLVIAEEKLTGESKWKTKLQERIALREMRDDQAHAADLAIYYLDVAHDPKKALYWAERNWRDAREPSDKQLLIRAQQLAGVVGENTSDDSLTPEAN